MAALFSAPLLAAPPSPKPKPAPAALRILSDTTLGEPLKYAVDVRWASDRSVYLALKRNGVVEHSLDKKDSPPKQLIPGEATPGGLWLSWHLAASSLDLVAAAPAFALTWRPLASAARKQEAFEFVSDIDLRGKRLAVLGARRGKDEKFAPDGAIAWIGSLNRDLADLKPLVFDDGGPGAPNMNKCALVFLGVTRFLADGSLLILPGVQPGIYRFDGTGRLLKTLETVALGIDTDCAGISKELKARLARHSPERMAWVNERRIVDDVLPLPSGPGLLIRSLQKGQVQWTLKVLHDNGSVSVYDVPVRAKSPFAHLKGDLRQGRLVLLLWEYAADGKPDGAPLPHLLIAEPPAS